MKKAIAALGSFAMALWVGIGAYLMFFQSWGAEKNGRQHEEAVEAKPKHEERKTEKKDGAKEAPKVVGSGITSVITTVSEENDWRLETPIDTLNFDDPKDLDKARRKIARDIRVENRKALAVMKESTAEEKEKREQTEAIEAWLEKETRQDAIK